MKAITDKKLLQCWAKQCVDCKEVQPLDNFYKSTTGKYGVGTFCRKCGKLRFKKRYIEEKEDVKIRNKNRYIANKEKVLAINKRWKNTHPEKMKEQAKKDAKKRRSTVKGRISQNISSHISHILNGEKRSRKWEFLLGFTVDQLKTHLEKQFTTEMSWDNYGSYWHIDHKIPKSVFNYEKAEDIDFKRCWALKNLQPLEATINIKKQDKLYKPFQPALLLENSFNEKTN